MQAALLAFEGVTVVRVENRFAEGCDNAPIGGYCDLQLQVGLAVEGGSCWAGCRSTWNWTQ